MRDLFLVDNLYRNVVIKDKDTWQIVPRPEVLEWSNDHLSEKPEYHLYAWKAMLAEATEEIWLNRHSPSVTFASEADMIAFKLRWS